MGCTQSNSTQADAPRASTQQPKAVPEGESKPMEAVAENRSALEAKEEPAAGEEPASATEPAKEAPAVEAQE